MDQKAREAAEKFDSGRDGCQLFRIAKQRIGEKKDVGVIFNDILFKDKLPEKWM